MSVQWPTRRTMLFKIMRRNHLVELAHIAVTALRIPGEDECDIAEPPALEQGSRFDQHLLTLPVRQPRGEQHHPLMRRHVPFPTQILDPLRRDGGWRKGGEIGSAIDHPQSPFRLRIHRRDQPGRVMGIGDDDIAAGHHGIVPGLDAGSGRVRAVISGHERKRQCPCSAEPRPGRGARAGMDQAHTLVETDPGEAPHVPQHRKRVFGRRRKADPDSALSLQFADEPPALRRDQRPCPAGGECGSDIDGRTLRAAGFELGNDLQNRLARKRMVRRRGETNRHRMVARKFVTGV